MIGVRQLGRLLATEVTSRGVFRTGQTHSRLLTTAAPTANTQSQAKLRSSPEAQNTNDNSGVTDTLSNSKPEILEKWQQPGKQKQPTSSQLADTPKPDKLYKTIELELLAYEPSVLDSYQWFILTSASHLQLQVGKVWQPFRFSRHLTVVNKSAHVHKKARVHYELRTYHRYINLHKLTGSTADTFVEYIQRNLPEGVGLKVTKCEVLPLPDFLKSKEQ